MPQDLREAALAFHHSPKLGKLKIQAMKPLAYSPCVTDSCEEIATDPAAACKSTERGIFYMSAVSVVESQTRLIEHNIARALDAQAD